MNNFNGDINFSAVKNFFMQKAWYYYNINKNEKLSIFYQLNACGLGHHKSLNLEDSENNSNTKNNLDNNEARQEKVFLENLFDKKIGELMQQNKTNLTDLLANNKTFENTIHKSFDAEITQVCREQLPDEWTIIQITKNYNPLINCSTYKEIVNFNTGLLITVLKHSAINSYTEPLLFEITKQSQSENVFETCYQISTKVSSDMNHRSYLNEDTDQGRAKYWMRYRELESYIENSNEMFKKVVGPWACVFTGNFKSLKSLDIEAKIKKKVNEFFRTHQHFDESQQKLIHLIARRTDLLNNPSIFVAISYVLRDKPNLNYDDIDLNNLYDFLTWIKQEYVYEDVSSYPCILIVDEFLDQLPFEYININQEITRISSFYLLKNLTLKYSNRIKNGYLMCSTDNANVLINPDSTLNSMETRMKGFFNYWLPHWNLTCGTIPSKEQYKQWLSKSSMYVYCGHGSGVQFLSYEDLLKISINCVVFLFGCGSVALTSSGFFSELKGAHLYYQLSSCPAIIGMLWTVTDSNTDLCSTKMLSSWVQTHTTPHWHNIDRNLWCKDLKISFNKSSDSIFSSDSLPEIVMKLKADKDIPVHVKTALVYRGLPVKSCH